MTGILLRADTQRLPAPTTFVSYPRDDVGKRMAEIGKQVEESQIGVSSALSGQRVVDPDSIRRRIFDALAEVKVLTSRVAMHLDASWRRRLFEQLDSLHEADEWEPNDLPIQEGSFRTFLKVDLAIKPDRPPGLGLSYTGNLIAAWTTDLDRLTLEFLDGDRVRWVLSIATAEGRERYAGDVPVTSLLRGLSHHNPARWFSNE